MKKFYLKCPHCDESVGFVSAFQSKANREFVCQRCGKGSDVLLKAKIVDVLKVLAVLVGLIVVIFSLFLRYYIWGAGLIILLFLAFYLQVPRFIILKKKNDE